MPKVVQIPYSRRDRSAPPIGDLPLTRRKWWAHDLLNLANGHPDAKRAELGLAIPFGIYSEVPIQSGNSGEQNVDRPVVDEENLGEGQDYYLGRSIAWPARAAIA
jgi:hypothetical protein